MRSTQLPPHSVEPVGHWHEPSWQSWPFWQTFPHSPQWSGSELGSIQPLPQSSAPEGQVQAPALQPRGAWQALPQAPQFATSAVISTHCPVPVQSALPLWQVQRPFTQALPRGHDTPQAPQCAASDVRDAQTVPHRVCPAAHSLDSEPVVLLLVVDVAAVVPAVKAPPAPTAVLPAPVELVVLLVTGPAGEPLTSVGEFEEQLAVARATNPSATQA